ncbi:MAG: radical SAM protein, partial [Anaerolineae bacterium]|nr:radical SAM protein [Anaerolineae bacterium]
LLERVVTEVPDLPWVRLMYAYPGAVTPRLIDLMASAPQILPYLDIPLQHGHRATLLRMRRPANVDWVYRTIADMRSRMPHLAIRTTFIVGYPGETEEEFAALLKMVEDLEFDRVGAFTYSYEVGTPSATLPGHVPDEVKAERHDRLMALQQGISLARNQALVGQTLDVLVEGHGEAEDEDGNPVDGLISLGRSYRDAPEIDGYVFVDGELPVGEIVPVRVTGAMVYDLLGSVETGPGQIITPGQVYSAGDLR